MSEGFPTETQASPSAPEPQPKQGKGLGRVVLIVLGEESEQNSGNTFVFDVEGPKGSGQLIIVSSTQDLENVESAVLRQGGVDYPLSDYLLDCESLPQ